MVGSSTPAFARALASLFVSALARQRALAPALTRVAVAFVVKGADGAHHACTALLDDAPRVLDGCVLPPGTPALTVTGDEPALRALCAGHADLAALAAAGRLTLEGPPAVVAALAACFPPPVDVRSVRLRREIPRAKSRGPA